MIGFHDISAAGTVVIIKALPTFPQGIICTDFAHDADPLDVENITVAETSANCNGAMVKAGTTSLKNPKLSVIPGSPSDVALNHLLIANTPAMGRVPTNDNLTMTVIYPSGVTRTFANGVITGGPVAPGIASAGSLKSSEYTMSFQDVY
jgi:hypothetical protein